MSDTEIKNDSFVKRGLSVLADEGTFDRSDANETAFVERQLVQLRSKEFDVKYASNIARSFLPMATDIAASASVYSYLVNDKTGAAMIGGNGADDAPQVEVSSSEVLGRVVPVRSAFSYDLNEVRESVRLKRPLSARKQEASRTTIERAIDGMLYDGGGVAGITGVSNAPSVASVSLTDWTTATPVATIVGDLNTLINTVAENSLQEYAVTRIQLPLAKFNIINTKFVGVDNTVTILSAFLANHKGVQIMPWHRLSKAIASQATADILEGIVPQEFEQLAPQSRNMKFVINTHARCGGVAVYNPLGMLYGDFA